MIITENVTKELPHLSCQRVHRRQTFKSFSVSLVSFSQFLFTNKTALKLRSQGRSLFSLTHTRIYFRRTMTHVQKIANIFFWRGF